MNDSAAWWQRLRHRLVGGDLRAMIAALDDEKLVRLREGIYSNPRGLKGYHIRMVTDECARRGL